MDRLLALPIRGESFLLQRGKHNILVDGGWEGDNISQVLDKHVPSLKMIHVVVCSHGDEDHAGGLPALLRSRSEGIGQVWLPGRWADVIPELLRDPKKFVSGLIAELDTLASGDDRSFVMSESADQIAEILEAKIRAERNEARRTSRDLEPIVSLSADRSETLDDPFDDEPIDLGAMEPIDDPEWFAPFRHAAADIFGDDTARSAFNSGLGRIRNRRYTQKIGQALAGYWLGLIKTAKFIYKIAEQAIQNGLRIRWFDFDAFSTIRRPRGGIPNFLVPLNAVEQALPPQVAFSYLARLSPINEESLAFLAPPTLRRLGVVFCGDSPMGDGSQYRNSFLKHIRSPWLPVVATAPHHGSENNRMAYGHLGQWTSVVVWLRAGGSKKQPGPTFQKLIYPARVCSKCPKAKLAPILAAVSLTVVRPWLSSLTIAGHECVCA